MSKTNCRFAYIWVKQTAGSPMMRKTNCRLPIYEGKNCRLPIYEGKTADLPIMSKTNCRFAYIWVQTNCRFAYIWVQTNCRLAFKILGVKETAVSLAI